MMDKKILYIGGGVAALGVAGGLVWYFTRKPAPKTALAPVAPPPRTMVMPQEQRMAPPPSPQTPAQQQQLPQPQQVPTKLPQMFWSDKKNQTRAANTVEELRHGMWKEYGGNLAAARMANVFFDPADPRVPKGHAGAWRPAGFLVFPLADDNGDTITFESQLDNLLKISSLNDPGSKPPETAGSVMLMGGIGPSQGVAHAAGAHELHNYAGLGRSRQVYLRRR